jgi:hypothetical protein
MLRNEKRSAWTPLRAGTPVFAGFVIMTATAAAQTIIAVDAKFHPPDGFSFQGSWKCGDTAAKAILRVGKPRNRNGWHSRSLASSWTEIRETEKHLAGDYFVAYHLDQQQFIIMMQTTGRRSSS